MAKKYSRSQYKKERNANKDTRPIRNSISEELENHIEESKENYIEEGIMYNFSE